PQEDALHLAVLQDRHPQGSSIPRRGHEPTGLTGQGNVYGRHVWEVACSRGETVAVRAMMGEKLFNLLI
ncbi:MAG: hypothetical protein D6790_09145, partial [Caldilineae bacterium]